MTTEELKQWIRNNIADRKRWATPLTRVDVGWKLFRDQRCLCPGCRKAGAKLAPVDDEPSGLTKVTAADIKRGGLAAYAVHVEHSAPRLRAIDLDCPGGHAKAGTVCNGYGVGVDLCYPRITAARRANRTARLRRASPQG